MQELDHYIVQVRRHRKDIPAADQTLETIRQALFAFFGIKEGDDMDTATGKATPVPKVVLEKWYKDGMPSPPPWMRSKK